MKGDISNSRDINQLVNAFYDKVKIDDLLQAFFMGDMAIDWDHHLPVMCAFWENALFYTGGYSGDMMEMHRKVHERKPMKQEHFERWTGLFCQTVDSLFEGETAERAKQRALGMATMLQIKIPVNP